MATTKRGFVFATFLSSCLALILIIVALATEMWISSDLIPDNYQQSEMNAGLFKGSYKLVDAAEWSLTTVCNFGENVCIWSCMQTAGGRKEDLAMLLNGTTSSVCRDTPSAGTPEDSPPKSGLMNAALWLSTVLFLSLALAATAGSALMAVLNTATNPSKVWLAIDSLYVWNGVAALLDLLYLVLWGVLYSKTLKDIVSIPLAINGTFKSAGQLGWSYWILVVPPVLSLCNVVLILYRDYSLSREPPPPVYDPEKEAADGTIFLY